MHHDMRRRTLDALIADLDEPVAVSGEGGNVTGWLIWYLRFFG